MGKFTTILKKAIFVWGLICLSLVLFVAITLTISTFEGKKTIKKEQERIYEKSLENINLKVKRDISEGISSLLINISRSGSLLVNNYRLPIEQYNEDYLHISDSVILSANEEEIRIILYTIVPDIHSDDNYIWFLKLRNELEIVHVIKVSSIHKYEDEDIIIFGNEYIHLPNHGEFLYDKLTIPIGIRVNKTISKYPMLSKNGIDIIKQYYKGKTKKRIASLDEDTNKELLRLYEESDELFNKAISKQIINY